MIFMVQYPFPFNYTTPSLIMLYNKSHNQGFQEVTWIYFGHGL